MDGEQPNYCSYLLRLWRENDNEMLHQVDEAPAHTASRPIWLASLESSLTGKRQGFANLEDLFAFLRRQTGTGSGLESEEARPKGQRPDHRCETTPQE
jgi:hypothetical protein